MSWQRQGECLVDGDWRIFRYALGEPPYYELWHWPRFIGRFESAAAAKQHREDMQG